MINEDMLIDFPADTYHHFLTNNIEGDKIKYLLVTHSHQDHFYCEDLEMRHGAFSQDMRTETLQVYCGKVPTKRCFLTVKFRLVLSYIYWKPSRKRAWAATK